MRVEVDPTGAPVRGRDHRSEIVQAAGAATTLISLAGVFALAHHGINIMGWYANWIIPIGSILVGLCAASGYGIAAWYSGLKMTRRLVISIIGQLVLSYFIAQYEEYQQLHIDLGFTAWFDAVSRAFTFGSEPYGAAGYFFRALEIGGFVLGGVLAPLALRRKPYCEPCRTYRRTRTVAWIPGGVADDFVRETLDQMFTAAAANDRAAMDQVIRHRAPLANERTVNRQPMRIGVTTVRCPRCADGALSATRFTGHGKRLRRDHIAVQPVPGDRMRALFD
jgi:hypothetical protein